MTSKPSSDDRWPLPLADGKGEVGDAVRAYARSTDQAGDAAADFRKLMARVGQRPRRGPAIALAFALGASVVAAGGFLLARQPTQAPSSGKVVASGPAAPPTPPVLPAPSAPPAPALATASPRPTAASSARASVTLRDQPVALLPGETDIVGKASARLSPDAAASGRAEGGATEIDVQRGEVELHVLPQAPGQRFVVTAGPHRFTVVGTVFTIARRQGRVELRVRAGAVAVSRGARRLAVVEAGGRWNAEETGAPAALRPAAAPALPSRASGPERSPTRPLTAFVPPTATAGDGALVPPPPLAAEPVPAPPAQPPPAAGPRAPAREDCRQLAAAGHPQEAVRCYRQQAARNGLTGETAAYELARLWRDTLGEPDRAVAAFEEQRSRFPAGALRREADLSIIELLPRLGRHADALAETQRFLSAHPRDERRGELHLLRGNIYREAFRDLARAQLEYGLGAAAQGRAGDDSRFFHAVCLEALGKPAAARAAYQAYLDRRDGAHRAEVSARLSKLAP